MDILLSVNNGLLKNKYFPEYIMKALSMLGTVHQNHLDRAWTEEELAENIKGMDICITHWGSPKITEKVLENADKLKLVAHCAGSVYNIVDPAVYKKGITVIGANKVMAKAVAEGTLAYMLALSQKLFKYTRLTGSGEWKKGPSEYGDMKSLFGKRILLVGFGDIGRFVYDLLVPFETKIIVYDPYIKETTKSEYPCIEFTNNLDGAIQAADIISLHASKNPGTDFLINRARIDMMKDDALFINTARGSIVDEEYLTYVLETGRISAALDVYQIEPLPPDSKLRYLPNVICMPHLAGSSVVTEYAEAMISDITNFLSGRELHYEIPEEKAGMMTRE
ncbi:MAG: hydroxyacid dehydrogenase [Clostridia bacterium]|nr:hydroxyacid dehydrogenase [Clostridia bacterium]MBN2884174.1 hydroxyacid dehydrogenase [Clostridia bacterium]